MDGPTLSEKNMNPYELEEQEMMAISPDGQTLVVGMAGDYWNDQYTFHFNLSGDTAQAFINENPQKMRILDDEGMFPSA